MVVQKDTGIDILAAWEASYFAELSHDVRHLMLNDAFVVTVPAGNTIYEAAGPPKLALLHSGQARVKVVSKEGRAATVRYAGTGQVIGLPSVIAHSSPVGADAITDCTVSLLNVNTTRELARRDASVAWLLARESCQIVFETVEFLGDNIFGSVQKRVSRHLLDLASNSPEGLVVKVEQQELADAIGSVREVVARTLRKLRDAGLISRSSDGIRIVDPRRLHSIASGDDTAE
ncbi:Crp/Fnr family transcriptional regulator [Rhodococcoides fascians A21d2]|uniref:Crp/Fnr family transcriptional regulator n=1 Tax=Rhodococcoides fascians TaxID=1828 RepID=UPI00055F9782|nr:Crp/Fnr family transcriptional regulator [Rhodococcus fascians]QII00316.1 Crp/Fnr family transcriptional regulator [Rhodococcus fascians A21d2]